MGNCFLRILETAGNGPAEISSGTVKFIRRKYLGRIGFFPARVNASFEHTAGNSAVKAAGNSAVKAAGYSAAIKYQQENHLKIWFMVVLS